MEIYTKEKKQHFLTFEHKRSLQKHVKWKEIELEIDVYAYYRSVVHHKGPQSPGETQTQQDVKDVAAYRVRHCHVPHAWKEKSCNETPAPLNGDGKKTDLSRKQIFIPTLSSYNQASHAVWYAGPCCQEGYTHDVVRDV